MSSQSIHVRPDAERVALLDAIRAKERTKPSRNAMATILLGDAIDREAERLNLHAWTERKAPAAASIRVATNGGPRALTTTVTGPRMFAIEPEEGAIRREIDPPPERLDRLRAAAGLSQRALCEQLGISYGKLQRARADGKVPPEVEAWMRQQEGGGR